MALSESFNTPDPEENGTQFIHQKAEQFSEAEFLLRKPVTSQSAHLPPVTSPNHWQDHLLPISCIAAEDNLSVLRAELEKAHHLLLQQQHSVNALNEQLTNRELQLQRTQTELATAQGLCERQSAKLTETDCICRDLKTQLRRQQQRVLQYRNLLGEQVSNVSLIPFSNGSMMAMSSAPAPAATAKSSPVSAWSAPHSIGLTGPLACYRELATIRMAPSSDTEPTLGREDTEPQPKSAYPSSASKSDFKQPQEIRIELPNFTRSAYS